MANSLDSNGQNVLEKKLSLDIDNTRVEDALEIISTKAGVTFTYSPDLFETSRLVSLHMSNARLSDVLAKLFNSDIDYEVKDTRISLNPGDLPVPISGKIRDENGEPLPGANVLVKGTTSGTITNEKGEFQLEATPDAILQISSIGYKTIEMAVGNQTSIDVKMEIDVTQLTEVVVVGYGTQKKATLAGSVSQVAGSEIMKSPANNITSSLQGRLPGLTAVQRSGQPGRDDAILLVRGAQTLGNSGPLIVIDGVQGRDNLSRLNPEDIENVTVLKDASAAIYGARGANGVILVTTKSGTQGKANFSFTYKYGLSSPTQVPDMLDAPTYANVYNEGAYYRSGSNPNYWNNPQYTPEAIQKYSDGSDPVLFPNTDWMSHVLKKNSHQQNINLMMSGGSDKVRYLMSFGTSTQSSSFRYDPTFYKQYNARIKVDVEVVKNLTIGANISTIITDKTFSPIANGVNFVNIQLAPPTLVARYPNGLIGPGRLNETPLAMDQRGYDKIKQTPLYTTFTASYKVPFVDGLKLDGTFNYDVNNEFQKVWSKPYFFHEYNTQTGNYDYKTGIVGSASLTDTYRTSTNMLYNLRVSYDQIFAENHHVFGMLGLEQQKLSNSEAAAIRRNFLSSSIDQINVGGTNPADFGSAGTAGQDAYDNYLGRFSYDFKSKYIFEFVFRYDGSPRFAEGNRYGFFPAVSGAWRISEEEFFKNAVPFVSQLKLRGSYGELGNDRINPFQYLQFFGYASSNPNFNGNPNYVFGTSVAPGLSTGTLPNSEVTWERAKKTDLGVEATLWNGKLGVDFTVWRQNRTDILVQRNLGIPSTMGFTGVPPENYGEVNSHGFELILSHKSKVGQLTYNVSGNIGYAVSEVIQMDEVPPLYAYQNATGKPLNTALYFKSDGIFNTQEELLNSPRQANQKVGDIKVVDLNEDGKIDNNDRYRADLTSTPLYVFGITTDFRYKNFDLNIFFQGQSGVRNYDGSAASLGGTDFANASVWRADDHWSESNPNGSKPRSDAYQPGNTDFFFFDASFVRLKSMELGYNLPGSLLQKTRVFKNFRVFASGFNLLTWAKDIKWADPELNGGFNTWPPQRLITFGASVNF